MNTREFLTIYLRVTPLKTSKKPLLQVFDAMVKAIEGAEHKAEEDGNLFSIITLSDPAKTIKMSQPSFGGKTKSLVDCGFLQKSRILTGGYCVARLPNLSVVRAEHMKIAQAYFADPNNIVLAEAMALAQYANTMMN